MPLKIIYGAKCAKIYLVVLLVLNFKSLQEVNSTQPTKVKLNFNLLALFVQFYIMVQERAILNKKIETNKIMKTKK